ncbi:MAG TPA: hypothetical protein V6D23_11135 [Candidatus Obscuribacterales bacterium]
MADTPLDRKAPASRLPLQVVLLMAISLALMMITWFKLAKPEFKESNKAQETARFYLEALGRAPIDKLGSELHPEVSSHFNPAGLKASFARLGLAKPLSIRQFREESFDKASEQWQWRIDLSDGQNQFPLLLAVRQPQTQAISRRWRVFALCRPDLDLPVSAAVALKSGTAPPLRKLSLKNFTPLPATSWKLVGTQPLTLIVPGPNQSLTLIWSAKPDGKLGCDYQLQQAKLRETKEQ